jgi:hypothetical protein
MLFAATVIHLLSSLLKFACNSDGHPVCAELQAGVTRQFGLLQPCFFISHQDN